MNEDIDLNEEEEKALDKAWAKVKRIKVLAKGQKQTKEDVYYTSYANVSSEQCRFCTHFVGFNECALVKGTISPEGWCKLFEEGTPLEKHCGVCEEDDAYFGAPIARAATMVFPKTNHANGVEIIALAPAGLTAKPGVWKPVAEEDTGLQNWIGGPQYLREEAAYVLDRMLKWFLVPVAYAATANDEKGAAIYFAKQNGGKAKPPEDYDHEWIEKAGVFDYITCQKDRGYKHNYLTHPDDAGRMILIDNGLCFPAGGTGQCHSPFENLAYDYELSESTITDLNMALSDVAGWLYLTALVGPSAVEGVQSRMQSVINDGWNNAVMKMPAPDHPRDSHGRWLPGFGAGSVADPKEKPLKAKFRDDGQDGAQTEAEKNSTELKAKLTNRELSAVKFYSNHGDEAMNTYLRTGQLSDELKEYGHNVKSTQEKIKDLDSALAKSGGMPENTVLYRGLETIPDGLKVGNTFTEKGYSSMSRSKDTADAFAPEGGAVMHIKVPKGTPGADIESMSFWSTEQEFVGARGTSFHIDRIKQSTGVSHIYAHVVNK